MGSRRLAAALVALGASLALVALLALPAGALANGTLTQKAGTDGCLGEETPPGDCEETDALRGASDIAVSPDGASVYSISGVSGNSLAIFDRAPDGTLTRKAGAAGCWDIHGTPCQQARTLNVPGEVAVSPDGTSVYVVALSSDAITIFDRAPDGTLTRKAGTAGCTSQTGSDGQIPTACVDGRALDNPFGVTVSPDGLSVYVATANSDAVAVFDRAGNGTLTQKAGAAGCISDTGASDSCADGAALDTSMVVAVSGDGTSAYVGSNDAVANFDRAPDGSLTQKAGADACFSETGFGGLCVDGKGLDNGTKDLAVSPDGESLYAATLNGVAILQRDANGFLSQASGTAACVTDSGTSGACVDGRGLQAVEDVVVSGDGRGVYTAARTSGAIGVFDRGPTGALTQKPGTAGCITETGSDGCTDGKAVESVSGVAVSPDGANVYSAAAASIGVGIWSGALGVFDRDALDPVAVDDEAEVDEDDPAAAIDVLGNDTDGDGGPISIVSATDPANGAVVVTGGGSGLTYEPDPEYCNDPPGETDDFTYTLDGGSTATVAVTVTCVEDAPIADDDLAVVNEDSAATGLGVLANDNDPDGPALEITDATQPVNGTVVVALDGSDLTYEPDPNYCNDPPGTETDDFTYTLNGADTATVSVQVDCLDDAPVAVADSPAVFEDSGANPIDVLTNDTDIDAGPKSISSATQPANGTVVVAGDGSGLTYEPDPNYCNDPPGDETDDFTYTLNGGSSASVSVTVGCSEDDPTAVDDEVEVDEDDPATTIDVLANDTDPDGGDKIVFVASDPDHGTVEVAVDGSDLTYEPDPNYCNDPPGDETDDFTYSISEGDPGTVSVTVNCVNDAPDSADAGGPYTTTEGAGLDLSGSGSDLETGAGSLGYSWDLDGDGAFDDATGASPDVSQAELDALAIGDGPATIPDAGLQVSDGTDSIDSALTTLEVTNESPSAAVNGPASVTEGQEASWTFSADDPSAADQAGSFEYAIDWNDDGTIDQNVTAGDSTSITHAYAAAGAATISVRATDKDGGESAAATAAVGVTQPPANGSFTTPPACVAWAKGAHRMAGTAEDDLLTGTGGDDLIAAGGGSDRLTGLGGKDCLFAGAGNDVLDGGSGRDSLLGRSGRDRIDASSPERDLVDCGGGFDRATVSPNDRVRRCERVRAAG